MKKQIDELIACKKDTALPAIGSDLDGFIKPTLDGLSDAADHRQLSEWLQTTYGPVLAERIAHGNALRVLEQAWMKPRPDLVPPPPP